MPVSFIPEMHIGNSQWHIVYEGHTLAEFPFNVLIFPLVTHNALQIVNSLCLRIPTLCHPTMSAWFSLFKQLQFLFLITEDKWGLRLSFSSTGGFLFSNSHNFIFFFQLTHLIYCPAPIFKVLRTNLNIWGPVCTYCLQTVSQSIEKTNLMQIVE